MGGSLKICFLLGWVGSLLGTRQLVYTLVSSILFFKFRMMDVVADVDLVNPILPILSLPEIAVLRVQGLKDALNLRRVLFGRDILKAALVVLLQDHERERRRLIDLAGGEGEPDEGAGDVLGGFDEDMGLGAPEIEARRLVDEAAALEARRLADEGAALEVRRLQGLAAAAVAADALVAERNRLPLGPNLAAEFVRLHLPDLQFDAGAGQSMAMDTLGPNSRFREYVNGGLGLFMTPIAMDRLKMGHGIVF